MRPAMQPDFEEVSARGLVKTFGATRAVAGVSMRLRAGTITAVLGHNGSGKSTLLAMLAGLARPTRGEILYGSHPIDVVRGRVGVLLHASMLYPDLTARENLALVAELHGRGEADVARVTSALELGAFLDKPVRVYSRGQLQRASLARALLPEPRLLLLDEPSTGLDAASFAKLVTTLRAQREAGRIVVLVTHDQTLVDSVADVVHSMTNGRLAAEAAA